MDLSKLNKEIEEAENALEELRNKKASYEEAHILSNLKEGHYYEVDDRSSCEHFMFRYTKGSVSVMNGAGTVGYEGSNYLIIHSGLYQFYTRTRSSSGEFKDKYFTVRQFLREFEPLKFREIKEAEFYETAEEIIGNIKSIKNK